MRAYYEAPLSQFLTEDPQAVLGRLAEAHGYDLEATQRSAWQWQVDHLQNELFDLSDTHIAFELLIPRMGRRADVVLVRSGTVWVLEYKVGARTVDRAALLQAHDYALDLKNFHKGSADCEIVPVAVATGAGRQQQNSIAFAPDQVAEPIPSNGEGLADLIRSWKSNGRNFSIGEWLSAGYHPTPTIIEAAQALYDQHSVEEISRSDAGAKNLSVTTEHIEEIARRAEADSQKAICFVTGVPGSGKTLAGLNLATAHSTRNDQSPAVFLSGNGPLVAVLREALARDQKSRLGTSKAEAARKVSSFVQNIHHFRDEALHDETAPAEHIVIFDEAQRAWTRQQASKFMQQKRSLPNFDQSEPEFLISVMDRHPDWCVVVCLIGGGQEINTGEAGLSEWLSALKERFPDWSVHLPNRLMSSEYGVTEEDVRSLGEDRVALDDALHLNISMRSFRAESLSRFVEACLDSRAGEARASYEAIQDRYPIVLTRSLEEARSWLNGQARGSERTGLLASSGAYRLRPEGLNVRCKVDAPTWFLNDQEDVRSSFYLEEVATEFDVQGLEIDWAGVCWDADLRRDDAGWAAYRFRGTKWQHVHDEEAKRYLRNAYRVNLTRARQGLIIYVPEGNEQDPTRHAGFYDPIADYLISCGIRRL